MQFLTWERCLQYGTSIKNIIICSLLACKKNGCSLSRKRHIWSTICTGMFQAENSQNNKWHPSFMTDSPPAKIWYIVLNIQLSKKLHCVFSEAFFVCSHHKYAGQPRLVNVHKEWSPKEASNSFTEGALGGPYLMSERKGTSGATVWVQIVLEILQGYWCAAIKQQDAC